MVVGMNADLSELVEAAAITEIIQYHVHARA
jgi:hypothetical protein